MAKNINIDFDYLDRVRKMATLYTKRKTSDLFDGDYHSRQHGRSLDFDDLREYQYGDDVSMIDWKSSSRLGKTLIRRYFADRRLNVIFVGDTGSKMTGDTPAGESKEQIALMALGITAYLVGEQGATYALSCCGRDGQRITPFISGPGHLEELIHTYKNAIESGEPAKYFAETLENTASSFSRHMIMVIITDAEGLAGLNQGLLKRLTYYNDVYVFSIEDAFLTQENAYDLETDKFADPFFSIFKDLHEEELKLRSRMDETAQQELTPNRVFYKKISKEEEIIDALIWLFGRRRGIV